MLDISRFLTAGESHGEALTAVIANALLEKSGGDSIDEIRGNDTTYQEGRAVKWLERASEC